MVLTDRKEGQTAFGSPRVPSCTVAVNTKAGSASGVVLLSSNGTEVLLWARNDGSLWRGTRTQFENTPETTGTSVG